MWASYPQFSVKTFSFFRFQILGGRGGGKASPGHAAGLYCNNNSSIYLIYVDEVDSAYNK